MDYVVEKLPGDSRSYIKFSGGNWRPNLINVHLMHGDHDSLYNADKDAILQAFAKAYLDGKTQDLTPKEAALALAAGMIVKDCDLDVTKLGTNGLSFPPYSIVPEKQQELESQIAKLQTELNELKRVAKAS